MTLLIVTKRTADMARPRIGDEPLTAAERQRRRRERLKLNRDAERSHETTAQAAELERLNAELAKMTRSRNYWQRQFRDDEQRKYLASLESDWKEYKAEGKPDSFYESLRLMVADKYDLQLKMPMEVWRRLVQLTHPDKHNGSEAADEASKWLLANKPDDAAT